MTQETSKKVKVVGTQKYINSQTGEIEEMQVTTFEDRDYNFTKIWLKAFINAIDLIGNKKIKFAYWLIDNLNKDNMIIMTMRQMADKSDLSLETVRKTVSALMDADFLRRVNMGAYMVNPAIMYKGSRPNRLNLLQKYSTVEYVPISDDEKIANLENSIKKLTDELDILKKRKTNNLSK